MAALTADAEEWEREMQEITNWVNQIQDTWRETAAAITAYLPAVLGALLLVLLGWLLARVARSAVVRLAAIVNRAIHNLSDATSLSPFNFSPQVVRIFGNAAYWLVILVFLTAAARSLELHAFSIWLARILNYVPVLLAGVLIIVAGYIASIFVRDVTSTALSTGGFRQGALLASLAQAAVLLTAVVIGVDQIGVDVSFLITIIAISLGGVIGGFALAFGFGSRDFISNLIAANELQKHYQIGQTLRVGDTVGDVIEFTPTSLVLATADGRTTIPAQMFHQAISALVASEEGHD